MATVPTSQKVSTIGSRARKLRVSGRMTRRQLAAAAGVSTEEVHLFERNLPVPLDSKRRMLRELWARKVKK